MVRRGVLIVTRGGGGGRQRGAVICRMRVAAACRGVDSSPPLANQTPPPSFSVSGFVNNMGSKRVNGQVIGQKICFFELTSK